MSVKAWKLGLALCLFSVLFLGAQVSAKYTVEQAESFVQQANKSIGAEQTDVPTFAAKIVKAGLGITSIVFFILIFYGGYVWLLAQGSEEKVKKARDTIIASIIGLFIIVSSYAITNMVVMRLFGKQTSGQPQSEQAVGGKADEKDKGCCLNEVKAPGSIWDIGSQSHWFSSIASEAECSGIGKTCTPEDQLCGKEHWEFIKDVVDEQKCKEAADKM